MTRGKDAPFDVGFSASTCSHQEEPGVETLIDVMKCNRQPHTIETIPGVIHQHFEMVDSTQDQVKLLVDYLPHDTWVILSSEEQTKGRGTHGRSWLSPPHVNIYATFMIPFPKLEDKFALVSQISALAISRTLKRLDLYPEIKWPNDVLLNGKKISGTLSEFLTPSSCTDRSVCLIGVGLNVNMQKSLCDSLDQPVTSLFLEAKREFDTQEVLAILYEELRDCIDQFLTHDTSYFTTELNMMMAFKGKLVIIDIDGKPPLQGIFEGIDDSGKMKLRCEDGSLVILHEGRIRN